MKSTVTHHFKVWGQVLPYQSLLQLRSLGRYQDQHLNCWPMHCLPRKPMKQQCLAISLPTNQCVHWLFYFFGNLKCTYFLNERHCAARVPARTKRRFRVFLHQSKIVSGSQLSLQKQRGTHTTKLSMGNDGNTIAQNVCFIHMMGRKKDSATWKNTHSLPWLINESWLYFLYIYKYKMDSCPNA